MMSGLRQKDAPCPEGFKNSEVKCLIILKDANFDPEENPEEFDLRGQLAGEKQDEPHDWWRTIANWCAGISSIHEGKYLSWSELQKINANKEGIKHSLKSFAFMQLKKTVGVGFINDNALRKHAENDTSQIKEQIDIYRPDVIICCGGVVGNIIAGMFAFPEWGQTRKGVQFATRDLNGQRTFLINYIHPSARAAKNIVCYGIIDAYREIVATKSVT